MGTVYLTELANVLRDAGLPVVEVDHVSGGTIVEGPAWRTRSRSSGGFNPGYPLGVVWHHTASSPNTSAASNVGYIIHGSENAPVCGLYLHDDGVWYVCAAGASNTQGKGGPQSFSRGTVALDQGNTQLLGIEAGNSGVGEPWPQVQLDSYFAGTIALCDYLGVALTDVTIHGEYAEGRKIDPATAAAVQGPWRPDSINSSGTWDPNDVRNEVVQRGAHVPPPPDPEDDMKWSKLEIVEAGAVFMGLSDGVIMPQAEWVNGDDPVQLARYNNYERHGWGHTMRLSYTDLTGVCLLGSVPGRDDRFFNATGQTWNARHFGKVVGQDQ